MSQYTATITWERNGALFTDNRYSRGHRWSFDGGVDVPASSSPAVVKLPLSVAEAVDPEEAFVASLSSCHMLSFLWVAARQGFVVERYVDEASGILGKNAEGREAMTRVTLRPAVAFSGPPPTPEEFAQLHEKTHERCFIANSVKTEIVLEPRIA